ncbi:MAG: PKD domain-containing protein [Verrucomicrobia bacterium]|nr:MAG: PKD domain-containing protein [Verrucomicrobiota bacterium]
MLPRMVPRQPKEFRHRQLPGCLCMRKKVFIALAAVTIATFVTLWIFTGAPARSNPPAPTAAARPSPTAPVVAPIPTATPNFAAAQTASPLFRTRAMVWAEPVPESAFARFKDWTQRYLSIEPASRAGLVAEGIELATARRAALKELIKTDPERALQLAVPSGVRKQLPAEITSLLENSVSTYGKLAVLGVLAEPGHESENAPNIRTATIDGHAYQAFTYGNSLGVPTRNRIALNGITVDDVFAWSENALRILDADEAAAAFAAKSDPICSVTSQPASATQQQVAGELAGEIVFFCRPEHALETNDKIVAAADGPPSPDGSSDPQASTWTEGEKKLLIIRVDFPDLTGVNLTDIGAVSLINNLNAFYSEMSFGRASFASNSLGSDFTPVLRMPQPGAYYGTNDYYNQLRTDARNAATAAGYTLANYNLDVICFGAVSGWTWAGLGYVGASGAWLRNSFSTGVAGHELGHNYGLNHANYWDTGGASIFGPGTSVEYGDSFDTMGSASAGNNHFNARNKAYLNWLTTNEIVTATSNGTYRIACHDNTNSTGLRGLKIVKSGTTNYWVEFRQKFTSNKWLMSGAGLRWGASGNNKSQLLDFTPGTSDAKNDSAIVIGRTYSDSASGIHITPVGKGGTTPESLDVVVNLGSFAGNHSPTLDLTVSATNVVTGAGVTFAANATDADGDPLAYYWEFGESSSYSFGTNSPTAGKSWTTAGDYLVRCVVSDMKGGVASKWVIVRVGSPTTYRITGNITDGSAPVEGVRASVTSARLGYTDSDGNYAIVGLPAGAYTVSGTLYGFAFTPSNFTNTVSVGPDQTDKNLLATPVSTSAPTITTQPVGQTVNPGASVTFSVVASGATPLSYQWRFNGANISGATSSSYTKSNVQATNAGNYSVVVSNLYGTATSANAVLSVNTPPVITTPPASQTVIGGSTATFTVTATGTVPLAYQWRCNGTNIPGANLSSYARVNAQAADAGNYLVVVTNSLGSVTSAVATLTVNYTLTVTAGSGGTVAKLPDQTSYAPNSLVTVTAASTSSFPFSGWTGDASGTNNPLIVSITTNLNFTANFASPVPDLIVDNPQAAFTGTWATDTAASDKYGADDRTAASVSGSATATATFTPTLGTAGTYDLYLWFPTITRGGSAVPCLISGSLTNFTLNLNETSGSGGWQLLASGVQFNAGTNGYVRIANNAGAGNKNVAADAVRWSYSTNQLFVPPAIVAQPQSQRVLEGSSVQFNVGVSGSSPRTCQWRLNSAAITGAITESFTLSNVLAAQAGLYDVTINNSGGSVTSAPASLVVSVRPLLNPVLQFSNGTPRFTLSGTAGDLYTIQTSSNLSQWSDALSVSNQNGSVLFQDSQGLGKPARFYRARLGP